MCAGACRFSCCDALVLEGCGCNECLDPNCWTDEEQFWRWHDETGADMERVSEYVAQTELGLFGEGE